MKNNYSVALLAVLVAFILIVPAVSAGTYQSVAQVISPGATVFIGEQGLNMGGIVPYNGVPNGYSKIGWWASAAVISATAPTKTIDLLPYEGTGNSYTVSQADYVGYTGNWYYIDGNGNALLNPNPVLALVVADPSLSIDVWNAYTGNAINGQSVVQGTNLSFRINTNMYGFSGRTDGITNNTAITPGHLVYIKNVSCGLASGTYTDSNGGSWVANTGMSTDAGVSGFSQLSTGTVTGTSDPALYNPWREFDPTPSYGNGTYTFSVPNGAYNVTLKYVEMQYSAAGQRSFNVYINGNKVASNFDILATSGAMNKALDEVYPVTVNGGQIVITLQHVNAAATISAIQITQMSQTITTTTSTPTQLNPLTDGFIDIKVKPASGNTYTALYNENKVPTPLTNQFVNSQPYFLGGETISSVSSLNNQHLWYTKSSVSGGQYDYPPGTYTIWAESTLNNMKANYRNSGADYTGKTVSAIQTITIASDVLKLEAGSDTVVRGKPFSVTLSGSPLTNYTVWVKGTSTMSYTSATDDNVPPAIAANQAGVFVGDVAAANYVFQNGAGRTVSGNTPPTPADNVSPFYAIVQTDESGVRTVEFDTSSFTKAQKYTIRAEVNEGLTGYKSDEVSVDVEKGAVTIVAAGDQSYYLGEDIKLSGTNSESYTTYLYLIGPNLPSQGSMLSSTDPKIKPVLDGDASTFTTTPVNGDNTWSYDWGTAAVAIDAGTYTIYAVNIPQDAESLDNATYATTSIVLKKPFVSASVSQSIVAQGDKADIVGTAQGTPSQGVAIWILGKNYYKHTTQSVNSDSSFDYEIKEADTKNLATGQYFIVVQHPMQNDQFDIVPEDAGQVTYVDNLQLTFGGNTTDKTRIFQIQGSGSLQGSDAAEALVEGINDANVDDTYTKLQFLIETPQITIDPIADKHVGDKFTITASTNLAVGDQVQMQVYSSSFKPTQKTQSGEFSGATGTVAVIHGDQSGLNKVAFDVDTSTFRSDEYLVTAQAVIQDATGTQLFNVLDGSATAVPTATPVITATTVPTPAPTAVPTTVAPTTVPTTTKSPGYGALVALIGLAAVGFIIIRRN